MFVVFFSFSTFLDSAPTELLRNINLGIKAKEEARQLQEAEIKLYHQWKINNPVIQKFEKAQRNAALKSAWYIFFTYFNINHKNVSYS